MFKKIRERLESFRVRNIIFLLKPFERNKENTSHRRLLEDFDLGGKLNFFYNLGGNLKFY
ncbi:hypothetical protein IGI04_029637 [Brassica rapa subsp. trilocularis]|uniref:Uncharacterized protein n=1 Tax=Brassica rapa subsp. trilocularis TaxID=1813537 RepID=A0ABQ7LNF0_BRACM|nr:hypothetical protein IGI04_029637 [Brassica rapa subsp. trilocularis]